MPERQQCPRFTQRSSRHMTREKTARLALWLALLSTLIAAGEAASQAGRAGTRDSAGAGEAPGFQLHPCIVEGVTARCGTYEVTEDRSAGQGRRIPLNVVLVPAVAAKPLPDPLVLLVGGPGSAATSSASDVEEAFGGIHRDRDVLMVDYRGTGTSNSLRCPHQTATPDLKAIQRALDAYHHTEDVKRCREVLSRKADVRHYTTAHVVDDIEEVRAALGYGKINLWGFSYGSRVALVYLRRHPESIRTVFVAGVVPTDMRGPLPFAYDAQASLAEVFDACSADTDCAAAFPDPWGDLEKTLERLRRGPVQARFPAPNGDTRELRLSYDAVVRVLRGRLYSADRSFALPALIHQLSRGNFDAMGQLAWSYGGFELDGLSLGFYLSIYCNEDVPFIDPAEVDAATSGSFFGSGRVRGQMEACRHWPTAPVPEDFLDPVRSDLPVLMVSGAWDPSSAARHATRAARTLSNSRHLILPWSGHGPSGLAGGFECLDGLLERFVRAGTHQGLDTSCIDDIRPPDFATSASNPIVNSPVDAPGSESWAVIAPSGQVSPSSSSSGVPEGRRIVCLGSGPRLPGRLTDASSSTSMASTGPPARSSGS